MTRAEVLIVGAGPAGIAAAVRATGEGRKVSILDDNPRIGGQIWRGASGSPDWFAALARSGADVITGVRVIGADARARTLRVESTRESFDVRYEELILATGAREWQLPFPGWTLPNVMSAGGLHAMVKSGLPVRGKRVVVAGSGPLLLAVAAYLRSRGATVPLIAEQTEWGRLARFSAELLREPGKLWQAVTLGAPSYSPGTWVIAAEGEQAVSRVVVRRGTQTWRVDCDYAAIGFGLRPNTELAELLGCRVEGRSVWVDELQFTSVDGVWCAGEACGIGGVDLAIVEGEIAGYGASGNREAARRLFAIRQNGWRFAGAMRQAFALRDELREMAKSDTIVCRCEDVTLGTLEAARDWRSAKLHTRCGMGPCQGRVCGPALEFLKGWKVESVRPPVFPARIGSLLSQEEETR
jgi:NADPH-dependent 2,4-dienoyl-CoA reductase/sulfur reductase-like enzyme